MAQKKSWKGKKQYASYKNEGRAHHNKVRKLQRHCKNYPEDEEAIKSLAKLKDGILYTGRTHPREPGSNQTFRPIPIPKIPKVKTPAQQLSELLGIPVPKPRKKFKPKVTHKQRRNVKPKTVSN